MPNFRSILPALGRVVIEPLTPGEQTASGLYLVGRAEQAHHVGTVVAVSDKYQAADDDEDFDAPKGPLYHTGEIVLFGKYTGNEVTLTYPGPDGMTRRKTYLVIRESEVLGTLSEGGYRNPLVEDDDDLPF